MNLEKILNEIYEIDANLREHDEKLRKAVELMLNSRPQINVDENFEKKLRDDLLNYARTLKNKKTKFILNFHSMKKFLYALGGVALAALVIVPLVYQPAQTRTQRQNLGEVDFSTMDEVVLTDSDDFDLDLENYSPEVAVVEDGAYGLGGGVNMEKALSSTMIAPRPYGQNYTYKYVGTDVELADETLPVLKSQTQEKQIALNNILKNFAVEAIDLGKFENLNINNISLVEDKEDGYEIYIDLKNSNVNIYRNWDSWAENENFAIDKESVTEAQILKVANDFVQKYGVNLENYGEPELSEDFEILTRDIYKPESYNVIYPLLVDGKKVVSEWGSVNGLNLTVDLRSGTVSNLYGMSMQTYEGKKYPATQDFEKIKNYIEELGYEKLSFEDEADVETVEVQTPEVVWLEYYTYNKNKNQKYLVPALMFEAEYPEDISWRSQNIVIPLVKDMLERFLPRG